MLHIPFRHVDQLKGSCETFTEAYTIFLQSGNVPPSLDRRLNEQHHLEEEENEDANEVIMS